MRVSIVISTEVTIPPEDWSDDTTELIQMFVEDPPLLFDFARWDIRPVEEET